MSIRTPDQRLRIFVSSTLQELAEERQAVREAIEGLRLAPVMFELGARPHPPRALYRAYLEQSEIFVGLYWQRYGWVAPGEPVSGIEDEYNLAGDRPKLIYLKEPAPDREPRLASLLSEMEAQDQLSYRRFRHSDELRALVADDLALLVSERFGSDRVSRRGRSLLPADERPLPRPLTRLIGRDADDDRVTALLDDDSRRLVNIVGPGGVGKTRLALAVADRVQETYADGVFFVELAGLDEPHLVIPFIARALGVAEEGGADVASILRRALGSADCLIILDNVEQLARAAPDIVDLAATTKRVQFLATSRSVLNVRGEAVYELGPLEVPTSPSDQVSGVELFLDRIVEVRPGFTADDDDRAAIAELTRRLDGLPLAIELAAAQTRVLAPRGLLERIGYRRLSMLRNGPRDLPERQQTLREAIGRSYERLDDPGRLLFERLAVVAGSADAESIAAIADPEHDLDTLAGLGSLVEASLVRTIGDAGEVRFGLLETIREFATERLQDAGQLKRFRARHAEHYLALAARGSFGVRGSEQLDWLGRCDLENDNFRAVLRRAIRSGDAATGARLGLLLSWYWQMRSQYTEGRSWMRAVGGMPGATAHERATAWTVEAMLGLWQGRFDLVEAGVDEAIDSLRSADEGSTLGLALLLKAAVAGVERDRAVAQEAAAEASELLGNGDPFLRAAALLASSHVARRMGRIAASAAFADRALAISISLGEWYIRSNASAALAAAALENRDLPAVRRYAVEALTAAKKLRTRSSAAYALELWAAAELHADRIDEAGRLYALSGRVYGLAGAQPWRSDAQLYATVGEDLRRALGPRLDRLEAESREVDLDAAVSELVSRDPAG